MSNLHRIQWIDARIRSGCYPNARTIAEYFEISPRQAARDIEYLRYSMGAPLAYAADKSGYYYEDQAFVLPSFLMTSNDKDNLTYLAAQYRTMGSETAVRLATLFEKLAGGEGESDKNESEGYLPPVVSLENERIEIFRLLQHAIQQRKELSMRYINTSYKVSERVFCPYKLFTKKGLEYVVGFCRLRAAIRFFRVDRIKRLTELDKTFQIEPDFNPDEYGETVAFRLRRPYTARIRFEKSLQSKLLTKWEQEEENIYRVPFFNSKDLISELISQPCDFLILSPDWLRQRFIERLKKLCSSNMQV